MLWAPIVAGSLADLVLVARNAVLVAATVTAVRALTRAPDHVRVE